VDFDRRRCGAQAAHDIYGYIRALLLVAAHVPDLGEVTAHIDVDHGGDDGGSHMV
jgi:hypothetical protein